MAQCRYRPPPPAELEGDGSVGRPYLLVDSFAGRRFDRIGARFRFRAWVAGYLDIELSGAATELEMELVSHKGPNKYYVFPITGARAHIQVTDQTIYDIHIYALLDKKRKPPPKYPFTMGFDYRWW
jgi:hypothetical protein